MCLKTGFLTEFPPFLDSTIKIVTYIIHYLVFPYWWAVQAYFSPFWGVMAKKRPKISLKSYFLLLSKIFEIIKLGNYKSPTHQTCPRYVPPQYLSFTKKWGCQSMGGWGRIQKTTKKYHKINIISTSTWPNNSLKKLWRSGLNVILNHLNLLLLMEWRRGVCTARVGGGLLQIKYASNLAQICTTSMPFLY